MNSSLFHRYYTQQTNSMETNPELRTALHSKLSQPRQRKSKVTPWLAAGSAATVLAVGAFAIVANLTPHSVTADALLRRALAAPVLQSGQIYQSSHTRTSQEMDIETNQVVSTVVKQTTISDGTRLEKLVYDDQNKLTGAELAIPQDDSRNVYDVYTYGDLRQFQDELDKSVMQHRVVYNMDLQDDVSSDDPATFVNAPDGWSDSYGRSSILEVVAGSSLWRPYLTNDVKHVSFFAEPIVTEEELNGIPAYKLDEQQPNIGFQAIGWIAKDDGRLLQEQTILSNISEFDDMETYAIGDITTYSTPVITTGTVPSTVEAFVSALGLDNVTIQDFDLSEIEGDTIIIDDAGSVEGCDFETNNTTALEGMCAPQLTE